ncbi:hypothetical protein BO71DRAFT_341045 [Aspergillus ellipticus CBS 707.79]|uniref:Uncharacterized protein n=1 Tax=Aspergillus ellipticus CBS 707.79 TaxID=1448320 RepID=A0A319CPX6_9EURO|nr:hypothetical protein BO71DRAFT_341045 [Aspergillus ellipticus CBS 707.79]
MAWYSLLPPEYIQLETWVARIFIFLGVVTIFPWAALLIFDIGLYVWRMVTYEFPVVGGRARGRSRPRAPSLNERPSGQPRVLVGLGGNRDEGNAELKRRKKGMLDGTE